MNIVSGILVFVMLWWMVFFMALPWGNRVVDHDEQGLAASAPENPRLLAKALVTTGISMFVFYLLYLYVPADLLQWEMYKDL